MLALQHVRLLVLADLDARDRRASLLAADLERDARERRRVELSQAKNRTAISSGNEWRQSSKTATHVLGQLEEPELLVAREHRLARQAAVARDALEPRRDLELPAAAMCICAYESPTASRSCHNNCSSSHSSDSSSVCESASLCCGEPRASAGASESLDDEAEGDASSLREALRFRRLDGAMAGRQAGMATRCASKSDTGYF